MEPKNWPPDVKYLLISTLSPKLSPAALKVLQTSTPNIYHLRSDTTLIPPVRIAQIQDSAHPAYGQRALQASRNLKAGTFILPYHGLLHSTPNNISDYDLSLDRLVALGIDAQSAGNEARFINDYRGISAKGPNAEFREIWDERSKRRGMGVFVLSEGNNTKGKRGIAKGEEILVSYGRGFWNARKEEEN